MSIKIIAFGKIADITQQQTWSAEDLQTTDEVRAQLAQQFPALQNLPYLISVNKKIAHTNTPLPDHAEVALLPPFSGG